MNSLPSFLKKCQSLSRREKGLLVVFLVLVGSYLLYTFYFKTQIAELKGLQAELEQARNKMTVALAQGWDNIPQLEAQIREVKQQQEALYSIVPPVKDTPGLLEEINQLTTKYNLLVPKPVSFSELQKYNHYAAYTISISVKGRREAVYLFIHDLETLNRLIEVKKSTLQAESSGYLTGDLELVVYVLEKINPDPSNYPFMDFERNHREPYEIFQVISGNEQAVVGNPLDEIPLPKEPNDLPGSLKPAAKQDNQTPIQDELTASGEIYQVVAGDTLRVISEKLFGTPNHWSILAEANHLSPPYALEIGQEIRLPDNTYTVQPGDTLYSIALKIYGANQYWKDIAELNNMAFPYSLATGQKLILPELNPELNISQDNAR
ncbi:MAG: type 4a pilus biogenesis protein PilO [Syntrophomonadaceae bacterium]|nr:type 4a pilus biogenesis protein PilO [Syntrophomonadaceae bacterium]